MTHATAEEIARLALSNHPAASEFRETRRHLVDCPECREMFAACRMTRSPALDANGWILPRKVERPADQRAGVLADHQLVCGAGDYELDVIVREIDAPQRLDIGGQVTQAQALHDPARHVPLRLLEAQGKAIVSSTETDDFGEFDFSARPGCRYGLLVGERRDAPCVLVWDGDL